MPKGFCWPLYRIRQVVCLADCHTSQHEMDDLGQLLHCWGIGLWEGTLEI